MQGTAEAQEAEARRLAINAKNKAYRNANPERVKAWNKRYRTVRAERWRLSQREYRKKRYWSDPDYRLQMQLRSRLCKALGRGSDATAAISQCGCSWQELRARLESQFEPGMSWEQRSDWHIDHIYPLGAIDRTNRLHVLAACNWRNLRPVWAMDNWVKNAEVTPDAQLLFESILSDLSPSKVQCAAEV